MGKQIKNCIVVMTFPREDSKSPADVYVYKYGDKKRKGIQQAYAKAHEELDGTGYHRVEIREKSKSGEGYQTFYGKAKSDE